MFEITDLTTFLGWCSLFNLIYLCLATVLLITMKAVSYTHLTLPTNREV